MSDFLQRVEHSVVSRQLLRRGQKVLVAVSGGADSMVLLHALHRLAREQKWKLAVAHFNHQLRGRSSDADERLVRATARRLKLPCVVERGEVKRFAGERKLSIEMAARRLRHDFLARAARQHRIHIVALAHHADDQVELFFLRLLRGAGAKGLAGMKWRGPLPSDAGVTLIRPLLDQAKSALLDFAREGNIRFREDASNASRDIPRNRIRHELLPLLRRDFQPALPDIILRQMEVLGAESDFLDGVAQAWLSDGSRAVFDDLHPALQRRVLQLQLTGMEVRFDFDLIEQLRTSVEHPVMVSPALRVRRDRAGQLRVENMETVRFATTAATVALKPTKGEIRFDGVRLCWQAETKPSARRPAAQPGCEWFDADKVGLEVVLRHWRAGDRFQPIGMASASKLQDLFTDLKIPRSRRRELIVAATSGGEVWWVEGLRIAERFKLDANTRRRLQWAWQRVEGTVCGTLRRSGTRSAEASSAR